MLDGRRPVPALRLSAHGDEWTQCVVPERDVRQSLAA